MAGSLVNVTEQYNDGEIHLSWMVTSECQEIKNFRITWNNLQKPESCHGKENIKVTLYLQMIDSSQ